MNRRSFLKCSSISLTSVPLAASGLENSSKKANFKGRIYKALKGGKSASDIPRAYLKYAVDCENLIGELEKLYSIVWKTKTVPMD